MCEFEGTYGGLVESMGRGNGGENARARKGLAELWRKTRRRMKKCYT